MHEEGALFCGADCCRAEAGRAWCVWAELIRKVGISEQTFYRWKKQYVGMETDQARQMKQLQEENSRLKQLVADLSLDKTMLQDVLEKKVLKPSGRRPMVDHLRDLTQQNQHLFSISRLLSASSCRGTFGYSAAPILG